MLFRSTNFAMNQQAIDYASKFTSQIQRYQREISSGIRLHRPSDDPIAFRASTSLATRLGELGTEKDSIFSAQSNLNIGVSELTDANGLLVRGKVLAQQGIQALSESERNALAIEVEGLLTSLQNITRAEANGAYLFSGTKSNLQPFEFDKPAVAGGTLSVNYVGSEFQASAFISESISFSTLYAGDQVFGNPNRSATILYGNTGAAPGLGTDNMVGRATLQVRHTSTTYAAGSGVLPGTNSATGDSILGPTGTHVLEINDTSGTGTAGTVSLNGGEPIPFTNGDLNLKVTSPNGGSVFVDMSNIAAGFVGSVDITADGTLSVDGGLSTTPIDFSGNQTIFDSTSGKFTNINSSAIERTGDDQLEFPGTADAFQALYELAQDLRNTRGLSAAELTEALDRRIGELGQLSDHVLSVVGQQSTSLQALQRLGTRNDDLALETETQLSDLQSTNIPETVLRLQNDQNLLQFTYAITAEINSISLLDFLR